MRYIATSVVLVASLGANLAFAEAPVKSAYKGEVEFGFLRVTGNSESESLNAKFNLTREGQHWRNNYHVEMYGASDDDGRSAERYFVSTKHDYKLNKNDYLFGYASHEDDRFSGYDSRSVLSAGYGRRWLKQENMTLDTEIGPGYRIDNPEVGEVEGDAVIRVAIDYIWDINEGTRFQQKFSMVAGGSNAESISTTSLRTQINQSLSLKVGYEITYNHSVPDKNTEHSDTKTTISLVYGF